MTAGTWPAVATEQRDGMTLYRAGGISAIVLAVAYLVITGLYVVAGTVPDGGGAAYLSYLAGKEAAWWGITGLSVLTDVLFFPVAAALYAALAPYGRNVMLAGAGLLALFAILDLAITWPNFASLITLTGQHAAAVDDAQRAALVAAANYPASVLESSLFAVYAILVPAVGALLIGLVMRAAPGFGAAVGWLGVVTGVLGIVAVIGPLAWSALDPLYILTSVLTLVWILLSGIRLLRLSPA
jgi:hypothetical protein